MTDNSKKVSQLPLAANVVSTDRFVILKSPSGNSSVRTIAFSNLESSLTKASEDHFGVVKIGQNILLDANGAITSVSGIPATGASVGYVLSTNSSGSVVWQPYTGVSKLVTLKEYGVNTYVVSSDDNRIFVDPNIIGSDVLITLPVATAITGKTITIKNLNPGDGYHKVFVTTDNVGNQFIEDPEKGANTFYTTYEIKDKGETHTWIFDGLKYRHLDTETPTPVYYVDNNTENAIISVKNANNGNQSSAHIRLYNNIGNEDDGSGSSLAIGINSNTYANTTYSITSANDSRIFSYGGRLIIGTANTRDVIFTSGGTTLADRKLLVNSSFITSSVNFNPSVNNSSTIGNTSNHWAAVYSNNIYVSNTFYITNIKNNDNSINLSSNNYTWTFSNTGILGTPGDIIPSANNTYTLGNSSMRWEGIWVGGNSVTFADQNASYPDQTLTVSNGIFYITDSLDTKTQSNAGFQVGNFLLQNNSIIISNTSADINIGNTGSTGTINFKRRINVRNSTDEWNLLSVDPEGRVDVISEIVTNPANAAFSITSSRARAVNPPNNQGVLLQISGSSTAPTRFYNDSYGAGNYSAFIGRHARGPSETPTQTLAGDIIARFGANPYSSDGFATISTARVDIVNREDQTSTNKGSEFQLWTTANGSNTIAKRLTVNENGLTVNYGNVAFSDGSVQNTAFNATSAVTRINVGTGLTQSSTVGIVGIDSNAVLSVTGATNQITVANVGGNYSLSLPQGIGITSDVQFRNLTVANLTVTGVTTSAACTSIHDKVFNLAYDSTSSSQIDGGGFTLGATSSNYYVSVTYNLANNSWNTGNTNLITKNLSANAINANTGIFQGALHVGAGYQGYDYPNADIQSDCDINDYNQVVHQNHNSGTQASADYVAVNDIGSDSANYIDMGINSSTYANNDYSMGGPNDGYLYVNGGNLDIATQTAGKIIQFFTGNTTSDALRATINTTGLAVIGNVSATNFTGTLIGTANVANYIGSLPAANVVSNAQLTANLANYTTTTSLATNYVNNSQLSANLANYQTTAGLSANVVKLTANLANYVVANSGIISNAYGVFIDSQYIYNNFVPDYSAIYVPFTGLASNVLVLTANAANYIGSLPAANVVSNAQLIANLSNYALNSTFANYQTASGLAANVLSLVANNVTYVGSVAAANVVSNAQLTANLASYVLSSTLSASLAGYQTIATMATSVGALTSNNVTYVGNIVASNVVSTSLLNSSLAVYQTASGLAANVSTLTSNNTSYVGSVAAANVVSNSQLASNLANYVTISSLTSNLANYVTTSGQYTFTNTLIFSNTITTSGGLYVSALHANNSLGTSGQVLTSNGSSTYWSNNIPQHSVFVLNSDRALLNQSALQSALGVGLNLSSGTRYKYRFIGTVYKSSAIGTYALQYALGGTATYGFHYIMVNPCDGATQETPTTTLQMSAKRTTNFGTAITITGTNTGTTWYSFLIDGVVDVTTGGTFIPELGFTGTPGSSSLIQAGAAFEIWPVGQAAANTNIGGWA